MFEHVKQELISIEQFCIRLLKYSCISTLVLIAGLIPGVSGFMIIGGLPFSKAFINSISILGTIDIPYPLDNHYGQIFTGIYGLFIETIFFLALGVLIAPVVHRAFHKLHLVKDKDSDA